MSGVLAKLASATIAQQSKMRISKCQYAWKRDGCEQLGFAMSEQHAAGDVILRFDICNGFSATPRRHVRDVILSHMDCHGLGPNVLAYFLLRYRQGRSRVCMFGPAGTTHEFIDIPTGLQQGDPLSSLLFACVVDRVMALVAKAYGKKIKMMAGYIDDVSIACAAKDALAIAAFVRAAFEVYGLLINMRKSKVLLDINNNDIVPELFELTAEELNEVALIAPEEIRELVEERVRVEKEKRERENRENEPREQERNEQQQEARESETQENQRQEREQQQHSDDSAAGDADAQRGRHAQQQQQRENDDEAPRAQNAAAPASAADDEDGALRREMAAISEQRDKLSRDTIDAVYRLRGMVRQRQVAERRQPTNNGSNDNEQQNAAPAQAALVAAVATAAAATSAAARPPAPDFHWHFFFFLLKLLQSF
jgi:hypothetical protein